MQLEINLPYSFWEYKISGVYRIIFEDGTYYIGCSNHIRSRASGWESIMRTGKGVPGKEIGTKVIEKIKALGFAKLDVLELCDPVDLKDKEAFYLDKNKDDANMLSSADCGWKPVLQYTIDGLFIKRHMSISAAARYIGAKLFRVQRVASMQRKSYKGFRFVYEKEYVKPKRKFFYKKVDKKNGRNVLVFNKEGLNVGEFKTIKAASVFVGCVDKNVSRALNGVQKTAAGHTFKYSENPSCQSG